MTATDELRRLLDERGVEYETDDTQIDGNGTMYRVTYVKEGYGRTWVYEEPPDCGLLVSYNYDLGAEDAVEATLGRGECRMETEESCQNWMSCSECHADYYNDQPINYCPNCGRKVVS